MDTLEKTELTTSIRHTEEFLNQEYQFTIVKSQIRLAEKREEGEEHR